MSIHRKGAKWTVRYREGERNRSRSFDRKADAQQFDAEVTRRRQLGNLTFLDAGRETLDEFVTQTWAPTHAPTLSANTRRDYAYLYDAHIGPHLGSIPLRDLKPERIAGWQADRLRAGAGKVAIRKALDLLSSILKRAVELERIADNPVRLVPKARRPRRKEIQPLAPAVIEAMRGASSLRDATLISVLAYAGLRPSEALALQWADIREKTILVQRTVAVEADDDDTKTQHHRTVRLLGPLRSDLSEWRLASGRPREDALVFPSHANQTWTRSAYESWRKRAFGRALSAAGVAHATPYALRHSYASLLLQEGRSVIYVARQLGHDARLTLSRYGHVIDEFEDQPRLDAEQAIRAARVPSQFPEPAREAAGTEDTNARTPRPAAEPGRMELAGLEPAASWVRSRRSPN